jgi:hypothetical protein
MFDEPLALSLSINRCKSDMGNVSAMYTTGVKSSKSKLKTVSFFSPLSMISSSLPTYLFV